MSSARPFGSRVVRAQGAEAVGEEVRGGGVVAALPEPAGAVGGAEALGARCVCRYGCCFLLAGRLPDGRARAGVGVGFGGWDMGVWAWRRSLAERWMRGGCGGGSRRGG